jgi:hypothetical protein
MRLCAIHQPNFFPWLGYFEKIRRADLLVFLDDVDYPKSGNSMGSWVNRVRVSAQNRAVWIRAPVIREQGEQTIRKVRINESIPWRADLNRMLETNYRRAPRFAKFMPVFQSLLNYECELIADYNIQAVTRIAQLLGLSCKFVRQSEISAEGRSTELLVNIARAVGADAYLSGDGAAGYQDDDQFAQAGIRLERLNFVQKPYATGQEFVPGLSIIDYLMHCGPEAFERTVAR